MKKEYKETIATRNVFMLGFIVTFMLSIILFAIGSNVLLTKFISVITIVSGIFGFKEILKLEKILKSFSENELFEHRLNELKLLSKVFKWCSGIMITVAIFAVFFSTIVNVFLNMFSSFMFLINWHNNENRIENMLKTKNNAETPINKKVDFFNNEKKDNVI